MRGPRLWRCLRTTWIVLALASAVPGGGASHAAAPRPSRPLIVAHRGGAALLPENTVPAFDNAVALGVDMLEFDMILTKDDQIVIQHDPTINPAYCSAGPVGSVRPAPIRELTLAQVLTFDCGSRHRDSYPNQVPVPGTPMPTLRAFLARYGGSRPMLFGEIKMPGQGEGAVDPVAFAKLVGAEVARAGLEERFILQSSDWRAIDAMHAINPRLRTCLLGVNRSRLDRLALARRHHASCMLLRLEDADEAEVKRLQTAGVLVISDVVDDAPGWQAYIARGDDAIFTNDPKRILVELRQNQAR